jgi:hypothetical protein
MGRLAVAVGRDGLLLALPLEQGLLLRHLRPLLSHADACVASATGISDGSLAPFPASTEPLLLLEIAATTVGDAAGCAAPPRVLRLGRAVVALCGPEKLALWLVRPKSLISISPGVLKSSRKRFPRKNPTH